MGEENVISPLSLRHTTLPYDCVMALKHCCQG